MSNQWEEISWRGFHYQCSNETELKKKINTEKIIAYVGIDPTGESLHIGHFAPLYLLCHLARAGHRPIALLGGGTAKVGDPSGKTKQRPMLTHEKLRENLEKIRTQIETIAARLGMSWEMVDNSDWLDSLSFIDFMRDIGRHFSVNRMLSFDVYKQRLETGLSFLEFTYQPLQAFDFLHLYEQHNCTLQCGGADQWANIIGGVELIRRVHGVECYGLTVPLVTLADGTKMGKTEKGAIFIDPKLTSPFDFFQYWRNMDDADLIRFLKLYTFLPRKEIEYYAMFKEEELNLVKQILAYNVMEIIHGESCAEEILFSARSAFASGSDAAQIAKMCEAREVLSEKTLRLLDRMRAHANDATFQAQIPSVELSRDVLRSGVGVCELFLHAGLCKTKSEVRRLIQQGGARIFDMVLKDSEMMVDEQFLREDELLLRFGKKKFVRILVKDA